MYQKTYKELFDDHIIDECIVIDDHIINEKILNDDWKVSCNFVEKYSYYDYEIDECKELYEGIILHDLRNEKCTIILYDDYKNFAISRRNYYDVFIDYYNENFTFADLKGETLIGHDKFSIGDILIRDAYDHSNIKNEYKFSFYKLLKQTNKNYINVLDFKRDIIYEDQRIYDFKKLNLEDLLEYRLIIDKAIQESI